MKLLPIAAVVLSLTALGAYARPPASEPDKLKSSGSAAPQWEAPQCSQADLHVPDSVVYKDCVGFKPKNLLNEGQGWTAIATELHRLGLTNDTIAQGVSSGTDNGDFSMMLYGDTIVGFHVRIDDHEATAFYQFDVADPTELDEISFPGMKLQGAALYRTGDAPVATRQSITATNDIPEPGTYALMLAGLGMTGLVTRRRWRG